jgi:hypothetical protein
MSTHGQTVAEFKLITVELPEAYEKSTGLAVDLRQFFEKGIADVWVMRGLRGGLLVEVLEEDNDTLENGRFILRFKYPSAGLKPAGQITTPEFLGVTQLTAGKSAGVPTGSVSQAEFWGERAQTSLNSSGIPEGSISPLTFSGVPSESLEASVGAPAGIVSVPEFEGEPLGEHTHVFHGLIAEEPKDEIQKQLREIAQPVPYGKNTPATSGTPRGSISQPFFTGEDMGQHSHALPAPQGKISAPEFRGKEIAPHGHSVEFRGSVGPQTFTGQELPGHTHEFAAKGHVSTPEFIGEVITPSMAVEVEEGFNLKKFIGKTLTLGVIGK